MKKIDIYIATQFLVILVMALIGFITVFAIVDLIENLDRFIDNNVNPYTIFLYYLYTLPWYISIGLPMATLIATVFSIGLMVKRNEWTAMKSSGVSLYRIAAPLIIIGVILSILSYEFDNRLVSWGNEHRYEIDRTHLKKRSNKSIGKVKRTLNDVFLQKKGSVHISLSRYRTDLNEADGVTVLILNQSLLSKRIDAKSMAWVDSDSLWSVKDYSIRTFTNTGTEENVTIAAGDTLLSIEFNPDDITKQFKSPDELNYRELSERIQLLKENGVKTTRWVVAKHFKVSFAFTNLIVILFGLPLVVIKQQGGLSFGAGMSVFVIFAYYAFIKFGQSMGIKEVIDPITSAWMGNVVFSIGGIILLIISRK